MSYLAPCLADHPIHRKHAAIQDAWRIETGTVAIFILGPGPKAMHRASSSYYTGRIGSPEEWRIARRACAILSRTAAPDAGPAEIQAAIEKAAHEIANGITEIHTEPAEPQPNIHPRATTTTTATADDARRVLAAVELVTGIPARDMPQSTRSMAIREKAPRLRAKSHACLAMIHLFPGSSYHRLDDLLGFSRNTVNRNLARHGECYMCERKYAKNHAAIISKLSPA